MSRPHLRPHFDLIVQAPLEGVKARLEDRFSHGGDTWAGHITGRHAQLVIRRRKRKFWSPWLTFAFESDQEGTLLTGRFAPHPSAWTFYVAGYGMVLTSLLGLGFFGLSQWIAGEPPTMLWSLPIGLFLLAALYLSAFVGQRLSAGEMEAMRAFVVEGFEGHFSTRWREPREVSPSHVVEDNLQLGASAGQPSPQRDAPV